MFSGCVFVNVIESVPAFVAIDIPVPGTKFKVSVALSAVTSLCPATATVTNVFWAAPPGMLIVLVDPVPDATTPAPVKLKVVAAVVNADPSS